jgi:hypothetical protein
LPNEISLIDLSLVPGTNHLELTISPIENHDLDNITAVSSNVPFLIVLEFRLRRTSTKAQRRSSLKKKF